MLYTRLSLGQNMVKFRFNSPSLFLLEQLTSVSLFSGLQQTTQKSARRKSSFNILRCCFQVSLFWCFLAARQESTFCILLSQFHYTAETVHGEIFTAAETTTTACGKEVEPNQEPAHSPKRSREQKPQHVDHPPFWDTTWDKVALLSSADNKEDSGLELLCLNIPDSPGQPWLSSKAWDSRDSQLHFQWATQSF